MIKKVKSKKRRTWTLSDIRNIGQFILWFTAIFGIIFVYVELNMTVYSSSKRIKTRVTKTNSKRFLLSSLIDNGLIQQMRRHMPSFNFTGRLRKDVKQPRGATYTSTTKFTRTFRTMMESRNSTTGGFGGKQYCANNLEVINTDLAYMKNVILDSSKQHNINKGGEDINATFGQNEKTEYAQLLKAFFLIPCTILPPIQFDRRSHLNHWFAAMKSIRTQGNRSYLDQLYSNTTKSISNFTVLVRRGDYANLYWTYIELYNTYLTIKMFNREPKSTTVILMDVHPKGKLDSLWSYLFGKVFRVGHIKGSIHVKEMAWVLPVYAGPISQSLSYLPFISEFKKDLLKSVGVISSGSKNICEYITRRDSLPLVTLILRRNYIAHPRNPTGKIARKIYNEKELIAHLNKTLPKITLNAIQLDKLSIEEQLRIIYSTSVLIGVHGAGLGHALMLQKNATLIELFPSNYLKSPNPHFEQFAKWTGSSYKKWYSNDPAPKFVEWVKIPLEIPEVNIRESLKVMCNVRI